MAEKIFTFIYLSINTVNDVRKKQIFLWSVFLYALTGSCILIYREEWGRFLMILGCLLLCGGFSIILRGAVGLGDVLIVSSLFFMMDFREVMTVVLISMLMASIYGGILLAGKKANRKSEIPFIPFLLMGYAGGLCIC